MWEPRFTIPEVRRLVELEAIDAVEYIWANYKQTTARRRIRKLLRSNDATPAPQDRQQEPLSSEVPQTEPAHEGG